MIKDYFFAQTDTDVVLYGQPTRYEFPSLVDNEIFATVMKSEPVANAVVHWFSIFDGMKVFTFAFNKALELSFQKQRRERALIADF